MMRIYRHFPQIKSFLVVGAASTVVNYGVFFLFFRGFRFEYLIASMGGYISGLIFGYYFNRLVTFRSQNPRKILEFVRYIMVYIISLLLNLILLHVLVENFGLSPYLAQVLVIGFSTVTNFLGCTFFVFSR